MNVSISRFARWLIRRRGGAVWVYGAPLGDREEVLIRTSTSGGDDREFEQINLDGIVVWLDRNLEIDDVRIGWTPLTGFDVTCPWTATAGN